MPSTPFTPFTKDSSYQDAVRRVYAGRVNKKNGFAEIPTAFFVDRVDVNMPSLPEIGFYLEKEGQFELLKPPGKRYSPLALSLHPAIWIQEKDLASLSSYAESFMTRAQSNDDSSHPKKRMEMLRESAIMVVEDLFANPTQENIKRSTKIVGSFVYVLMKDPKAYMLLTQLSSHDPYTLQHSVGTAINCIILARKLGITDEKDLNDVGIAGLLHDIGKVHINKKIINKNGPLDEAEWEEMRQHAGEGYRIVKENPDISERTKRAILEHHEDKNGTGYPQGLKWEQVDLFSKIVCICDIFNALTTDRSYSKARTVFDALQFIREKMSHKIDEDIFKQLVLIYGGKVEP